MLLCVFSIIKLEWPTSQKYNQLHLESFIHLINCNLLVIHQIWEQIQEHLQTSWRPSSDLPLQRKTLSYRHTHGHMLSLLYNQTITI